MPRVLFAGLATDTRVAFVATVGAAWHTTAFMQARVAAIVEGGMCVECVLERGVECELAEAEFSRQL